MANSGNQKFLEVEYKFILSDDVQFEQFRSRLSCMNPVRQTEVNTVDTYFLLQNNSQFIYRHRFDQELQQLTVKSMSGDPSVRTEINLDLSRDENQSAAVVEFLRTFGIKAQSSLAKDLIVFYFQNVEIALYRAQAADRSILCLEIEAIDFADIESAKSDINKWCQLLGLAPDTREMRSLFEILLLPSLF